MLMVLGFYELLFLPLLEGLSGTREYLYLLNVFIFCFYAPHFRIVMSSGEVCDGFFIL